MAVAIYAVVLTFGLVRLAQGEAASNGWLRRCAARVAAAACDPAGCDGRAREELVRHHAQDDADDLRRRSPAGRGHQRAATWLRRSHRWRWSGWRRGGDRERPTPRLLAPVRRRRHAVRAAGRRPGVHHRPGGRLGWLLPPDLLSYPRMLALAQHPLGKGFSFVVVALFAWHAAHRILHSLHDVGIRLSMPAKWPSTAARWRCNLLAAAGSWAAEVRSSAGRAADTG